MKIRQLKEFANNFSDEDEVAIEINGELYDCYCYDSEYCRNALEIPTLVIAEE